MNKKIEKKIVGYKVVSEDQEAAVEAKPNVESNIIQMHEKVSRPEALAGSTYKIKTPMSDHAMYLIFSRCEGPIDRYGFRLFCSNRQSLFGYIVKQGRSQ